MNQSREGIRTAIPAIVLFLGGTGWILPARWFATAPAFARRMVCVAALYAPIYLVFLPLVLAGVFPARERC